MLKITVCGFEVKFTTLKKFKIDEAKVCVYVCVPSQPIHQNVVVITLGTVTAIDMRMHHEFNYIDLDLHSSSQRCHTKCSTILVIVHFCC